MTMMMYGNIYDDYFCCSMGKRATGPRYDDHVIGSLTLNNLDELSGIILEKDDGILGVTYYTSLKFHCICGLIEGTYTHRRSSDLRDRLRFI